MRKFYYLSIFIVYLMFHGKSIAQTPQQISLSGKWQVKLDSLDMGSYENWASQELQGMPIHLPGTLDDAGIGTPNTHIPALNNYVLSNLTRKHQYIGKAWYQKEINIPKTWQKKKINLILERVIWESQIFINGKFIGKSESLVGAHVYNLTDLLSPGKHLLTIVIDNSNKYPFINSRNSKYPDPVNQDLAHGYTNHTQIKWNGIIGDIVLEISNPKAPTNLQIYPNTKDDILRISYIRPDPKPEKVHFEIVDFQNQKLYSENIKIVKTEGAEAVFEIARPKDLKSWDEFNPNLYEAILTTKGGVIKKTFGFKNITSADGELRLNGQRIFLRGNLECAIFPLTGYPPMKKSDWAKLIDQAKNYGLNHLRFHSWCPPKAAFEAADEAGFYFQVEPSHWSVKVGQDEKTTSFIRKEAKKILNDYGNHPSFILMSLGNELEGDMALLNNMTAELRKIDNRHLYATTSFSFQPPTGTRPEPEDEFLITQWTDKGWVRGQGIFNERPPHFNADYSANSDHIQVPLISHEIGQYSVYPDLMEIPKYTGVLQPLNFVAVKNFLKEKGMLYLADDFTRASGKLAAMLYKEEIERALKTPGFDGFQLLQLQDFPGQGTALVGLLNAFWESKGIISGEEFRKFNSPLVPLIRFEKAVYKNGEIFTAHIEIANFLEVKTGQRIEWSITDENGNILANNEIKNIDLTIGNNPGLGKIELPINVKKAQNWTITVELKGTKYKNVWPIWVYPTPKVDYPKDITITNSFEEAIIALDQGKKVFLNPDHQELKGIKGRFVPVFWSPVHFPDQPGTMGLLIDNTHRALQGFPTKSFAQWQWWDLCINSKAITIDSLSVKPIVRVIDNFVTNRNLTNVFEARVGNGKLLFSSIDLYSDLEERPAANQLRQSLLNYMESDAFDPSPIITADELKTLEGT